MNKTITLIIVAMVFLPCPLYGMDPANYEININGKNYEISLGREYHTKMESGEVVTFKVDKKTVMIYKDDFISFEHNSDLPISSTVIGNGIRQTMTNTVSGTLILIQEYSLKNPDGLVDPMLYEITKEQINYGYKMQKAACSKTLRDGKNLNGEKATLSYNDEQEHWTVMSFSKRDKGLLIITKIDEEDLGTEKDIIDLMWNTLAINM
jgi:hypothetical protein